MPESQRLYIKESKDLVGFEQFEGGDVTYGSE